jgi:hypothetical protein
MWQKQVGRLEPESRLRRAGLAAAQAKLPSGLKGLAHTGIVIRRVENHGSRASETLDRFTPLDLGMVQLEHVAAGADDV